MSKSRNEVVLQEGIEQKIFLIRGKKVMLDKDLADLYNVPTKRLNEQVKRNLKRFPEDFMFRLTEAEMKFLRSQIATLEQGRYSKYRALAFTEQGVVMLSSVLNSERAIEVNILIMRAFVKMRELMISHKDLAYKIEELEKKYQSHDKKIVLIFEAIKVILTKPEAPPEKPKPGIGFHVEV